MTSFNLRTPEQKREVLERIKYLAQENTLNPTLNPKVDKLSKEYADKLDYWATSHGDLQELVSANPALAQQALEELKRTGEDKYWKNQTHTDNKEAILTLGYMINDSVELTKSDKESPAVLGAAGIAAEITFEGGGLGAAHAELFQQLRDILIAGGPALADVTVDYLQKKADNAPDKFTKRQIDVIQNAEAQILKEQQNATALITGGEHVTQQTVAPAATPSGAGGKTKTIG